LILCSERKAVGWILVSLRAGERTKNESGRKQIALFHFDVLIVGDASLNKAIAVP
jgi:hypothetical protein